MSTLKADAVTTKSDNTDLVISGGGSGVPDIEASFKVGGTAGVPMASIRTTSGTASSSTFLRGDGTWQAAGGAWSVLSSGTVSGASELNFASLTKTTKFIITRVIGSANARFDAKCSIDAGSGFITSNDRFGMGGISTSSTVTGDNDTNSGVILFTTPTPALTTDPISLEFTLFDPADTTDYKRWFVTSVYSSVAGNATVKVYGGVVETNSAINYIRFLPSSGTFSASYVAIELN